MPRLSQEQIVFVLWVVLFAAFALALPGFFTYGNIITLIRSVAVLGILAVGMAIVIIGRGIDLSLIAVMAVSTALAFTLMTRGYPIWIALLLGWAFAAVIGMIIGCLIAYVEIPALFATLAMGAFVYGLGRYAISVRIWYLCRRTIPRSRCLAPDAYSACRSQSCCLPASPPVSRSFFVTGGSANLSMPPATISPRRASAGCRSGRLWCCNMSFRLSSVTAPGSPW